MVPRKSIIDFLSQKKLAAIGVSRDAKQFSNSAYRLLKTHGFTVYPVNPNAEQIEGDRCFPNITSLPEKVDRALIMLPPEKTMHVLPEIAAAGIKHVWLQQQTESPQAIQFCSDHNINVVYGECIIMFVEPVGFPHRMHRWVKKVTGALPQ
jgi:predicted CoA-binding protein